MVHLCAPTTYIKQDKQLCDSKIYNIKHEGYHKVKCISKELGYRDNRGTRRRRCIPKFTLLRVLLSVGAVWRHKAPQTPWRPHRILLEPSHQKGSPWSTMEPWGWSPNPHKAWGNLHNLIGGSQHNLPQRPHKGLGQSPQLNWRPQEHHKAVATQRATNQQC